MPYRFQVEIDGDEQSRFDDLKRRLGINTNKELFDNAFTLLEWAANVVNDGNHIAEVDRDKTQFTVIKLPVLERTRDRRG
jgi:hypothetical protein